MDMEESATDSTDGVVEEEPKEKKVVTPKTSKVNKPKKATIEGQFDLFDLLSA